jgi:pSer/pThr/pTyr-binding forkhead associated (FHA) protein
MNEFLNDCGMAEPLQIAIRGFSTIDRGVRLLPQPYALIGRDQRADVPLEHRLVSRRHLYLQVIDSQAFWVDLESRAGTIYRGQSCKYGWLDQGETIGVGPFELQRVVNSRPALPSPTTGEASRLSPLVARDDRRNPLPEVSLEFLNGPSNSASWPMNRVMSLIGSASGCKFRLADPSVSPFHCSLVRTPRGLWVVDLLGSEPITVNDAIVRYALLSDQDILRVGRYRIRVRCLFQASVSGAAEAGEAYRNTFSGRSIPALSWADRGALDGRRKESAHSELPARNDASALPTISPPAGSPAEVDWELVGSVESSRLEQGQISESLLVPIVSQFGVMQQQMLDQFQQAISMLVQMFGNMHRDQMATIREELDQLKAITREFQELKAELAARTQSQNAPAPVSPLLVNKGAGQSSITGGSPNAARAGVSNDQAREFASPTLSPPILSSTVDAGPTPAPSASFPDAAQSQTVVSPDALAGATSTPPVKAKSGREKATSRPKPAPAAATSGVEGDQDVMMWLHQRMATLQEERETRWQKILKLLPGLS